MGNPEFDRPGQDSVADGTDVATEEIGEVGTELGESGSSTGDTTTETTETTETAETTETTETTETGVPCTNGTPDLCGDICTNVLTDPENCGLCGNLCNGMCTNGECLRKRFIFVTKQAFAGDLNGIPGATEMCTAAGNQLGDGEFLPWLSSPLDYPDKSMSKDGYFVRPDGVVVATSWTELTNGQLDAPINVFEDGSSPNVMGDCMPSEQAWTSTNTGGGYNLQLNLSCLGWTQLVGGGSYGNIHAMDHTWTVPGDGCPPALCGESRHLYCVEQ